MRILKRTGALRLVIGSAALAAASGASAGIPTGAVITYAAASAGTVSVPTLSEWGLICMALLVAVMAYRSLRGRLGDKPIAAILLAGALGVGGMASTGWIRSASAVVQGVQLALAGGGTANVYGIQNVDIPVQNTSSAPLKIVSVIPTSNFLVIAPSSSPQCVANLSLAVGATCYVRLLTVVTPV